MWSLWRNENDNYSLIVVNFSLSMLLVPFSTVLRRGNTGFFLEKAAEMRLIPETKIECYFFCQFIGFQELTLTFHGNSMVNNFEW